MPGGCHSGVYSGAPCGQQAFVCVQGWFLPHPKQAGLCHPKGAEIRKYRYNGVLRSQFIGAAATAALVGVEGSTIKMLGRWGICSIPEISPHTKRDVSAWPVTQ